MTRGAQDLPPIAGIFATDAGFEYEGTDAIDGCFGDMVLENTLGLLGQLGE